MGTKTLAVAHVCLSHGYTGNERQVELLIKELSKLGVPQALVCRADCPLLFHLDGVKGLDVIRLSGGADISFTGHFKVKTSYTVVHAHDISGIKWALIHRFLRGIPYVYTERYDIPKYNGIFAKIAYRNAACLVGISNVVGYMLCDINEDKVRVIQDCSARLYPDEEIVKRFKQSLNHRFVVGNISPLINRKNGQSVLIDAAKILKSQIPDILIIFVGSGDDIFLLQEYAKDMPYVRFISFKQNYIDYLSTFDVFVYPAHYEGSGSILLDAMEQGVPVVATNVGSIPDLVQDNVNGFLVEAGDHKMLAECILALKRNRGLYHSFVQAGYETTETHGSAPMAGHYYRTYQDVLSKKVSKQLMPTQNQQVRRSSDLETSSFDAPPVDEQAIQQQQAAQAAAEQAAAEQAAAQADAVPEGFEDFVSPQENVDPAMGAVFEHNQAAFNEQAHMQQMQDEQARAQEEAYARAAAIEAEQQRLRAEQKARQEALEAAQREREWQEQQAREAALEEEKRRAQEEARARALAIEKEKQRAIKASKNRAKAQGNAQQRAQEAIAARMKQLPTGDEIAQDVARVQAERASHHDK